MTGGTEILLITGPAGIGKSTLCWEVGAVLAKAGIAHAIIESDELDRVFPSPGPAELETLSPGTTDISSLTLAAIWSVYRRLGQSRLVMSGVMLDPAADHRWIVGAIPDARIITIRLRAGEATLVERLDRREAGSGRDEQVARTLRQARRMATESADGLHVIDTDGRTPQELAPIVLQAAGWLAP